MSASDFDFLRLALAALAASAVAWAAFGDRPAAALFALAFVGFLIASRLAIPRRALAAFGLLVAALIWASQLGLLGGNRSASTIAHGTAGAGLAVVLAAPLARRLPADLSPLRRFLALAALVVAIGVAWELAEWTSDALFNTRLARSQRDSALDLMADAAGACVGAWWAVRPRRRRRGVAPR